MDAFQEEIIKLLKKETKLKEISLEVPKTPEHGDYAFPCFMLSAQYKKNPVLIAKELAEKIKPSEFIKEVREVGPYINFFINKQKLAEFTIRDAVSQGDDYGRGEKAGEKIMVEFSQPNTHKSFHIGHVRNVCLGETLSRILKFYGFDVVRANYIGDIGPHVVKCLWGLLNFKDKQPKENKGRWLGEIYTRANKKIEDNEKLELEVREMTRKLYAGDKKLVKLWKETREWCLKDFDAIYKDFDVKFDRVFYESEVEELGKKLANELLKKGIAKMSEGAVIIDLEKYGLGIYLILRSDGVSLYSTKDIALAKIKFEQYKIDRSIYVVGSEQELYFKQLFKTLELMGFKQAEKCHHLSYALVMLPEGRMSSREGNIVLYNDLIDRLYETAVKGIKERHKGMRAEEVEKIKKQLSFAALKFGMLSKEHNRTIVFDWDSALDFEGETGPYVQYAHARICSILRKYGKNVSQHVNFGLINTKEEEKLVTKLAQFPARIQEAAENYKPYLVARYLLELAQCFNEFYHACPILQAEQEQMKARLMLATAVKQVLENGLYLLGIDAPEVM